VNRAEFQALAEVRLREAEALSAAGLWDGAYYLAGCAVECGLKACILARVERDPGVLFLEKRFSERCWSHDLSQLLALAALAGVMDADGKANPRLVRNRQTVQAWDEGWRYSLAVAEADARGLCDAIRDPADGVLTWISKRW
jgi:HEPN domain-containing protein